MSRACISDTILDGNGNPLAGATVALLRATDFSDIPTVDPGAALYRETAVSDASGAFIFDHLVPGDYHLIVQIAGQTTFRYFVAALPVEMVETVETQGRSFVPRTMSRLLAGENITIYAVGDDITVGYNASGIVSGSWVSRFGLLIGEQVTPDAAVVRFDPNSYATLSDGPISGFSGPTIVQPASNGSSQVIQIINCGVKGDTVQRVLRRADANLFNPSYGPVDLFLIQLGLNDSWSTDPVRFVDPESFAAGIHALVDSIRTRYGQAEIVLLTPACSSQPDAGNGGTIAPGMYSLDQYAMGVRRAALDLGVGLIDIRQMFLDHYNSGSQNDGFGDWLSTAGGNHSNLTDQGHEAVADEVFKLFGQPGAAEGRTLRVQPPGPARFYKTSEMCRLATGDPSLMVGSHWNSWTPGAMADMYFSANSGGPIRSRTAGDTVTLTDVMTDLAILSKRGADCGTITVSIDGAVVAAVDLYRGVPSSTDTVPDGAVYPMETVWLVRGLSETSHSAVITVTGEHDPSATDCYVYLDGVQYTRPALSAQRVETFSNANARVQFGAFSITATAAATGLTTVTFPQPFRNVGPPAVTATSGDNNWYCSVQNVSKNSADIHIQHRDGTTATATVTGSWIAIG